MRNIKKYEIINLNFLIIFLVNATVLSGESINDSVKSGETKYYKILATNTKIYRVSSNKFLFLFFFLSFFSIIENIFF